MDMITRKYNGSQLVTSTTKAFILGLRVLRGVLNDFNRKLKRNKFSDTQLCYLSTWSDEYHKPELSDYDNLFKYLIHGWCTYRTVGGAGADYPGLPSNHGRHLDIMEGYSRIMPLAGSWVKGGRSAEIQLRGDHNVSLIDIFKEGLLAGTNPSGQHYWGDVSKRYDQRVVEAADVALACWLFKDSGWSDLSTTQKDQVITWLSKINICEGSDNNWHLFYVMVDRALTALGYPNIINSAPWRFERVKGFHLGDGWFKDGPNGHVDYYNAWGFHYSLSWIRRFDPMWEVGFIDEVQSRFLDGYKHLIGPKGFPIMGRSICYRMAVAAPLVFGAEDHPDVVTPGEARRALDVVWSHFIRNGALNRGVPTQGYFASEPMLLDAYSGPASALWAARSLVAAFSLPDDGPMWQASPEPLPVEVSDFECYVAGGRWIVTGEQMDSRITIEVLDNEWSTVGEMEKYTLLHKWRTLAYDIGVRPANKRVKYDMRTYDSQ